MRGRNMEKKEKMAIALAYRADEQAPKILATGKGVVADKILEKAKESKVPLYKDEKLAKTLSKLDIGDMIPEELYEAVAEILVFVDRVEGIKGNMK